MGKRSWPAKCTHGRLAGILTCPDNVKRGNGLSVNYQFIGHLRIAMMGVWRQFPRRDAACDEQSE
jgi:hypothetical protein